LNIQKLNYRCEAEKSQIKYLTSKAESDAIAQKGEAIAESQSQAEADTIRGKYSSGLIY